MAATTDRLTTDELAAEVRRIGRAHPCVTDAARPLAHDLADELRLRLPYLEPADLAAVLMHASSCVGGLMARLRAEGVDEQTVGTMVVNTMAIAGEQMHRRARRDSRPDTTDTNPGA